MPGGVQTLQSLFSEEYIKQFSVKYVDWAPAPFDKLPTPVAEMGLFNMGSMQRDSPAPIIRVMHVISGIDRMFSKIICQSSARYVAQRQGDEIESSSVFGPLVWYIS